MEDPPATGSFDLDGWLLRQPGDDPVTAQFASAHESHHKQLQDSTSYGALARVYHSLANETGDDRYRQLAGQLTAASDRVQEAFSSWLPATALEWTRDRVAHYYPSYLPHYDAVDRLVSDIPSPYLRFHAVHAIGRACMQTTAIERALAVGLDRFGMADLRHRELPNGRFGSLATNRPQWPLQSLTAEDERLAWLIGAQELTVDMFDPALEHLWGLVNEAMYAAVAAALPGTTLAINEHLDQTPLLITAARQISKISDLRPGERIRQSETRTVVLGSSESETFTVAEPLIARILPASTDPSLMAADVTRPHLFATMRATGALFANYALEAGAPPADPVTAWLRRTIVEPDGRRVVELLQVLDALTTLNAELPIVAAIPCSSLDDPLPARWLTGERVKSTVLLLDVPLTPHLDLWLANPGTRFRYAFLRVESFGRVVPHLVGKLEHPDAAFPLMLRPLSHAGIRTHQAALGELYAGSAIEDGSFLDNHDGPLDLALAHLAGEEVRFGPRWR